MPRATRHLTLSLPSVCSPALYPFSPPATVSQNAGSFCYSGSIRPQGQYSSGPFPSQIAMAGTSCLAWGSPRINLIIKGLTSVQGYEPHVTCFGTQSASEIHLCQISRLWRSSKDGVPEQKCAASSLLHEGPVQLVHREKDHLFSLIFQPSVGSIKQRHVPLSVCS